jgi:hypothetical protein
VTWSPFLTLPKEDSAPHNMLLKDIKSPVKITMFRV